MKRCLFVITILLLPVIFISAFEASEGRIKLVIHEATGRFSLYYLEDVRRNSYVPLFLAQDPRTTVLSILSENRVFRMGEGSEFRQNVEQTVSGALLTWKSAQLEVSQEFIFHKSSDSTLSDGLILRIAVKNSSEQPQSVGIRYLFDTYLGERSNTHFTLPDGREIKSELELRPPMPRFLVSPRDSQTGLQIMLSGDGLIAPDRVIIANWKRLNDSSWSYDTSTARNFNLLPYSINDSAVSIYYNPITLKPGESRIVNIVLGNTSPEGFTFTDDRPETGLSTLYTSAHAAPTAVDSPEVAVRKDLIAITDLINQIEKKIQSGTSISEDELTVYRQILNELKRRKSSYEGR